MIETLDIEALYILTSILGSGTGIGTGTTIWDEIGCDAVTIGGKWLFKRGDLYS